MTGLRFDLESLKQGLGLPMDQDAPARHRGRAQSMERIEG